MRLFLALTASVLVASVPLVCGWLTLPASIVVAGMGFTVIYRLGWFWTLPAVLFLGVGSILSGGRRGRRDALQVVANGGVAFLFALVGDPGAYLTALTVGFADTVATEVGTRLSPKAYLITTFREVPAGVSGGVSLPGTLAGLLTVLLMSSFLILTDRGSVLPFAAASTLGFLSDSLIGATLEARGTFGNNWTNFLATAVGGLAYTLLHLIT